MKLLIQMGPTFDQVQADLGAAGGRIIAGASEGLSEGVEIAASNVIENHLSGQDLKRRTGNLARAVGSWMEGALEGVVGVRPNSAVDKYKWLLGPDEKTITPKTGKFLAIPIGEGLTPSGVPRYKSPREVADGFFVKTRGRLLFGYKKGKRGKFRPLFTLVKSVLVQGTDALYDGVTESVDDITAAMQLRINEKLN